MPDAVRIPPPDREPYEPCDYCGDPVVQELFIGDPQLHWTHLRGPRRDHPAVPRTA